MGQHYQSQIRTVILIELFLLGLGAFVALSFWDSVCGRHLFTCLQESGLSWPGFLFLSFFRPFVLTPLPVFAMMAGGRFEPVLGGLITAIGALFSCLGPLLLAKEAGRRIVFPWLRANFPETHLFLRSQDWKLVLASRLIPVLPFDLMTFVFGILNFRTRSIVIFTFLGSLPECYMFAKIGAPQSSAFEAALVSVMTVSFFCLLPGILIEIIYRKRGSGLWMRAKAMLAEILEEAKEANNIVKRHHHDPRKLPVLLLYGFFSSRKSLTVLERILTSRGYEVISFNLGGLLGVFFTRSITETAEYIDEKLKRQFKRWDFDQIQIIGHSKGGLVALWWLAKLGGHKHCKNLITLGTPFYGSKLTWLILMTPIGFLFRDMWQMRPRSQFLKDIRELDLPAYLKIYNLYSNRDKVTQGKKGILTLEKPGPTIVPVPLHHVAHFEFLNRKDVGDTLRRLLGSPFLDEHRPANETAEQDFQDSLG